MIGSISRPDNILPDIQNSADEAESAVILSYRWHIECIPELRQTITLLIQLNSKILKKREQRCLSRTENAQFGLAQNQIMYW